MSKIKGARMGKSELMCDCDILHHDAVQKVKAKIEEDEVLFDIADFYKALSDSTRIKIVHINTLKNVIFSLNLSETLN